MWNKLYLGNISYQSVTRLALSLSVITIVFATGCGGDGGSTAGQFKNLQGSTGQPETTEAPAPGPVVPTVTPNPAIPVVSTGTPVIPDPKAALEDATERVLIAKANEIIQAAKNPFQSKLPAVSTGGGGGGGQGDSGSQGIVDPTQQEDLTISATLLGIMYKESNPIALVDAGQDNTLFLRQGDQIAMGTGEVIVTSITKDSITLEDTSDPNNNSTFSLPPIVGFGEEETAPQEDTTITNSEIREANQVPSPDEIMDRLNTGFDDLFN